MLRLSFLALYALSWNVSASAFNERYGFWFMFESTCSPCLEFAPTLHNYITEHHIKTIAISKDSKPLRTWKGEWTKDKNGTLYRLGIEAYPTPTLLLNDAHTGERALISVGNMTEEELNRRVYELTNIDLGETE